MSSDHKLEEDALNQKLAYCGLGVADVDAWIRFGVEGLGLQPVDDAGVHCLRLDEKAWRIALHESPADDILYAGFELDGDEDLLAMGKRLDAANIPWTELDAAECVKRRVVAGLCVIDPRGLRLEFVRGHAQGTEPFHSEIAQGFVTGDQGLGHIVFSVDDLDQGIAFYEVLGLKVSDFITQQFGPDIKLRVAFLHCNARHHSVAIAQLPGAKRLNHLMVELNKVDDVIRGHARCLEMGYKTGNIGRHPNDEMLSFYVTTPAGFDVEYGWGARQVEDDWTVEEYDRFSLWGHERAG